MTPERDLEAAEYVLGTLDREERETFAARMGSDAEARAAVAAWERRLSGLALAIPPEAPPAEIWDRIEAAIRRSSLGVIEGGRRPDETARLRRAVNRWRAAAIAASGIAAALVVFIAAEQRHIQTERRETFVAAVNQGGGKPALVVRVDLATQTVYVRPVTAETPPGKSLELWYIGEGKPPRSMGVVEPEATRIKMPSDLRGDPAAVSAATFAVTVEPPGGSKTGGPTGPVVYSGQLIRE